jgi:universal stress protein E
MHRLCLVLAKIDYPYSMDAVVEAARANAKANLAVLRKWLESQNLSDNSWVVTKGGARDVVPTAVVGLGVDLIVMGTVGRTGNTAETVLSKVNCSVVTLKRDTFVSPAVPPVH